jgi:tRNA pseudouridine32 synthase/23S rRNA pseudouridine746 synthase
MTFQIQKLWDNVFNLNESPDTNDPMVTYWYEGYCPNTGKLLRLPRTHQIEAIARELMQSLAADPIFSKEGKMYGVLLVETQNGNQILKAFSGLLQGQSQKEGWVPPISGQEKLVLAENQTLAELEVIKQQILQLQFIPERQEYEKLSIVWEHLTFAISINA